MVVLEYNDVKWCFELREIVFHKVSENGVDYLDPSLQDEQIEEKAEKIDTASDLYPTNSEDSVNNLHSDLAA